MKLIGHQRNVSVLWILVRLFLIFNSTREANEDIAVGSLKTLWDCGRRNISYKFRVTFVLRPVGCPGNCYFFPKFTSTIDSPFLKGGVVLGASNLAHLQNVEYKPLSYICLRSIFRGAAQES